MSGRVGRQDDRVWDRSHHTQPNHRTCGARMRPLNMWARIWPFAGPWDWDAAWSGSGSSGRGCSVGIGQDHGSMTNSMGYDSSCHVPPALKRVQDRRCQSNVEPGGLADADLGYPRYRHVRAGRRPRTCRREGPSWTPIRAARYRNAREGRPDRGPVEGSPQLAR